ncbi:MAG: MotA/TolQ/ExbB proton channel family protein [Pseudomonadota bacterium]
MNELISNLAGTVNPLLDKGGPTMMALGLLSVTVVAVFLVRVLALLFAGSGSIVGVLSAAARKAVADGSDAARDQLEAAARQQAAALRSGFRFIDLTVTAAPLLGLLGTVLGMIEAFRQLEAAGSRVEPAQLAGGIWEALLTTAAGMVVALVALVCLSILEALAERQTARAERAVNDIMAGA